MLQIRRLVISLSLLGLSSFAVAAPSGGGGGSSGIFRRDFGLGVSVGSSFFDETASGTFYQHTGLAVGLEGDLRLGARLTDIFSLGVTGSYGINWFNSGRETRSNVIDHYKYETYQGLAGGFATLNIGATKESNEVMFEYYGYANQSVRYTDGHAENPYQDNGDSLSGHGWGVGFGGKRGDSSGWLFYRSLTFDNQKLGHTDTNLPTSSHSEIHYQMLVLQVGQSF
jgi:hypothetical protein